MDEGLTSLNKAFLLPLANTTDRTKVPGMEISDSIAARLGTCRVKLPVRSVLTTTIGCHVALGLEIPNTEPFRMRSNSIPLPTGRHLTKLSPMSLVVLPPSTQTVEVSSAVSYQSEGCINQDLKADRLSLIDQPGGADTVSKKRSANSLALPAVRASWMEQLLVVSSHDHQTAEELCTHGMSYGPDFVDSKGNYCDMSTKTLSPLCTGTETTGCVTFSEDGKTISKRSSVARRTVDAVHKSFTNVKNIGPK